MKFLDNILKMLVHLNNPSNEETKIYVDDPSVINLVTELKEKRKISQTELFQKLGRYKTKQALTCMDKLKLLVKEQSQVEVDFFKFLFGIHNGREKMHYQIGDNIEVQIKHDMAVFIIKGDVQ